MVEIPPEDLPYRLGRTVGLDVMRNLTDPQRNRDFRIGIVNVALQTGMLVLPHDSSATAQFLRGNNSFLWADAAQEIARTARTNAENFSFEIRRTTLTESNCPGLTTALESFSNELEKTRASTFAVSTEVPNSRDNRQEIVIDGTSYLIQLMAGDTKFTITPDNGSNSALNRVASELHRVAGGCTNSVPGIVEQFYY